MLVYRYYMTLRPPFIATHPSEGEVGRMDFGEKLPAGPDDVNAWGWVDYDAPLDDHQTEHFDMVPDPENPIPTPLSPEVESIQARLV
jgi:hypothetical protein